MAETASDPLYRLLAWLSPAYPIGAFSYSHGIESAVEEGLIKDLRWRNDTAHPIQVQAHVDARAGTVTVTLRGVPDGRTTIIMRPTQTERPDGGSTVRVVRRIQHADGVIQHETIISRYALLSPSPAR